MPAIAVVNHSNDLTAREARLTTKACHVQIEKHVAPLWYFEPWPVRFYRREEDAPDDSLLVAILEDERAARSQRRTGGRIRFR